ncbi:MAG TPA: DUF998 domain-containing protein [Cyclobacteriaceae bacterium]|nr:DUF998 domain-containing protein [Cyclobacteriaceae bacterium]
MNKHSAVLLSIASGIMQILLLAALHFLSPKFDPTWRVISEYALGQFSWVLSLMFITGALNVWALVYSLKNEIITKSGRVGLVFLIISGIGTALAAVFEIPHPLHNIAGLLGVLGLPLGAMLVSISISRMPRWMNAKNVILWTANLTWIGLAVFVVSMIVLMVTYARAGGDMSIKPDAIEKVLPHGTIAYNGIANRILVLLTPLWTIAVARQLIKFEQIPTRNK